MVVSGAFQKDAYLKWWSSAHKEVLECSPTNAQSANFFKNTFETLQNIWLRTRYNNGFLHSADKEGILLMPI